MNSLYISTSATSPASYFGGSWERYGTGRALISASDTDTDFKAGTTGGSKTHRHRDGMGVGDYYGMAVMRHDGADPNTGVIDYTLTTGNKVRQHGHATKPKVSENFSTTVPGTWEWREMDVWNNEGNTTEASSLEPYVAVYIWRRTA